MLISPPNSHAQAQTGGQKPESLSIHHDGVVHVKELPLAPLSARLDRVVPRRVPDPELLRQRKEELRHEQPKSPEVPGLALQLESALSSGPSIGTNFIGLRKSESGDFIPPDTQVAAGPNHIFEVVNTEGRIFMKDGTPISTFDLNTFFGLPLSTFLTDPKIRFDPMSDRWFVMAATDEDTFGTWRLAVSTSDDPTDPFVLYTFPTPGAMPDFPALGINDDKVILTGNAFACTTICGNTFLGTMFIVWNKANLVAGGTVSANFFPPPQGLFSIQPAHSLPSTTTLFMAAVKFGKAKKVRIWSVTGVPGVGGGATFTSVDLRIATLGIPPDAVQMGTSDLVATNDSNLLDAVFRDGSLWLTANTACKPSGDKRRRACLRFTQILTGALTVAQDFNVGTVGTYAYYAAIQIDNDNNLIAVFSRSSASEFASVYASGRLTTDTLNTLQTPVLIKAGEAPYGADRWGDYSGAGIDPSDQTTVWVAGEYALLPAGGSEWGTWIAQITIQSP